MGSLSSPIKFGNRLLPNTVDEISVEDPQRVLYSTPLGQTPADGFKSVTASEFANPVNRTSWFLERTLGGRGVSFETLGYIGPNDIRYFLLVLGAIKTGYKLLLNSPRNSAEGHVAVAQAVDCRKWLIPEGVNIDSILGLHPMEIFQVPSLNSLLDPSPVALYKYDKDFQTACQEPIAIIHTSGSTGHPKPIILTHTYVAAADAFNDFEDYNGCENLSRGWYRRRIYGSLPFFHAAGFYSGLTMVIFGGAICVVSPQIPSILSVENMLSYANLDAICVAPSVLQEITEMPSALEKMKKLEWACYGGGPLSKASGDRVSKYCEVQNLFGTTECGVFPLLKSYDQRKNWNYLHIHPNMGVEFRQKGENVWEMFLVRKPELEKYQAIWTVFPDLTEFSLHDLYKMHPTQPNLWIYHGRDDDIIVLSNGEKVTIQQTIEEHKAVRSALIIGQGKFQAGVIIEPVDGIPSEEDENSKESLIDSIFEYVERANRASPGHSHIDRRHILLTTPEKPFQRASKGTFIRKATIKKYEDEIEELYSDRSLTNVVRYDKTTAEELHKGIRATVLSISGLNDFADDGDLFAAGVDSLQVLNIQKQLQAGTGQSEGVDSRLIYSHPTIDSLSQAVWGLMHPEDSSASVSSIDAMAAMFEKYTKNLPKDVRIVLTGSTGSLGSYLLHTLMNTKRVKQIWCLNRSSDAQARQVKTNSERGLRTDWHAANVHFLKSDLSEPLLGLTDEEYTTMLDKATHIIHNQWQVNFNVPLSSFEPHVRGVRALVDFSSASTHDTQILFVSSIAVALNWKQSNSIPETIIKDFTVAGMGYGESKLVAENVLGEAAGYGIPVSVARVGQIAGPVLRGDKGMWSSQEWLPTIVKSSAEISVLPQDLGNMNVIDWIPVDVLSQIMVELALENQELDLDHARVFHLVNPHVTNWSSLLPLVEKRLNARSDKEVRVVPWKEWVEAIRQAGENVTGHKLLGFFEALSEEGKQTKFNTSKAQGSSTYMRRLGAVDGEHMELWRHAAVGTIGFFLGFKL